MPAPPPPAPALLSVRHLKVDFRPRSRLPWKRRGLVHAVDDMHLDLRGGETLGIVGESGCGKSTLARTLIGLQQPTGGSIRYGGREIAGLSDKDWRPLRREIQMVFQDPLGSLDPKMTAGAIVEEPLRELCPELNAAERARRVAAMLERVGLPGDAVSRYPNEFSGGQAQRVGIARALVVNPKVLICDEAVSALDVSVRAQIVNLLIELKREYGLSMIFIAHDLAVVRYISDRVLVMYLGKTMEQAQSDELFAAPAHPYTRALLAATRAEAVARAEEAEKTKNGEKTEKVEKPPDTTEAATMGCVFHARCPLIESICVRSVPNLRKTSHEHYAACHFVGTADSA